MIIFTPLLVPSLTHIGNVVLYMYCYVMSTHAHPNTIMTLELPVPTCKWDALAGSARYPNSTGSVSDTETAMTWQWRGGEEEEEEAGGRTWTMNRTGGAERIRIEGGGNSEEGMGWGMMKSWMTSGSFRVGEAQGDANKMVLKRKGNLESLQKTDHWIMRNIKTYWNDNETGNNIFCFIKSFSVFELGHISILLKSCLENYLKTKKVFFEGVR